MDKKYTTLNDVFNEIDNLVVESAKSSVGKLFRKAAGDKVVTKEFNGGIPGIHKKVEKKLSNEDLKKIKEAEDGMREATSYNEYKPYFTKFCNILNIKPTIIYRIEYDGNNIMVKYEDMDKDIIVPNGSVLTHVSPNEFDELIPSFKSKAASGSDTRAGRGGYFYSSPRVYVTLGKVSGSSAKNIADLKSNTKIVTYTIPENIRAVKVDPAIRNTLNSGAAYIETMFPIKVKKVSDNIKNKELKKDDVSNLMTDSMKHKRD